MRLRVTGGLFALLLLATVFTGPAAAQTTSTPQADGLAILENMEDFIASAASIIGSIVLIIGAIMYGTSRKGADRAQWGIRLFLGGFFIVIVAVGRDILTGIAQSFVPGMLGFL